MAERVAVIGAGQMGNGIAHVFAQSGFDVTMIDVSADALQRGTATIASNLDRQIKKGTLPPSDKDAILGRVLPVRAILRYGDPCARVLSILFVRGGRPGSQGPRLAIRRDRRPCSRAIRAAAAGASSAPIPGRHETGRREVSTRSLGRRRRRMRQAPSLARFARTGFGR